MIKRSAEGLYRGRKIIAGRSVSIMRHLGQIKYQRSIEIIIFITALMLLSLAFAWLYSIRGKPRRRYLRASASPVLCSEVKIILIQKAGGAQHERRNRPSNIKASKEADFGDNVWRASIKVSSSVR